MKTATEAIAKSERHVEFGAVKIMDPHQKERQLDQFSLMLIYWAARGRRAVNFIPANAVRPPMPWPKIIDQRKALCRP